MLSKPLAFEQDKTAIFLRNQELHLHFGKLDSIKNRKNPYLPEIVSARCNLHLKKNYSSPSILRDKQYFIQRDNKLIFQKLDKINKRANKINNDSATIDGYLNIKRLAREKYRELKHGLLEKENVKLKQRLKLTKSVINNNTISTDFQKLKKISGYLRKIRPQDSVENIYLNRKESRMIRQYEKEKDDYLLKTKDKGYLTRRRNLFSSTDNIKSNPYRTMHKSSKIPLVIDKKILRKVAYI
jgi:hypothetical protein